jgi:hypothetical protein
VVDLGNDTLGRDDARHGRDLMLWQMIDSVARLPFWLAVTVAVLVGTFPPLGVDDIAVEPSILVCPFVGLALVMVASLLHLGQL